MKRAKRVKRRKAGSEDLVGGVQQVLESDSLDIWHALSTISGVGKWKWYWTRPEMVKMIVCVNGC